MEQLKNMNGEANNNYNQAQATQSPQMNYQYSQQYGQQIPYMPQQAFGNSQYPQIQIPSKTELAYQKAVIQKQQQDYYMNMNGALNEEEQKVTEEETFLPAQNLFENPTQYKPVETPLEEFTENFKEEIDKVKIEEEEEIEKEKKQFSYYTNKIFLCAGFACIVAIIASKIFLK